MKLNDKKVIILGSLVLFVLSLLKKNDDKPLEGNNLAIVSDVEPAADNEPVIEDIPGVSDTDNKGVTDAPESVVSSAFGKTFENVRFSDINISRDLFHADHYTITHGIAAVDLARLNKQKQDAYNAAPTTTYNRPTGVNSPARGGVASDILDMMPDDVLDEFVFSDYYISHNSGSSSSSSSPKGQFADYGEKESLKLAHELELNDFGVRDQAEAVKQAKENKFIFDNRLVSINGQNIDLDDKSKVTEWDMMPLIDNYGRVYNGENDVPYIPQFLIFGHVPLGWQLVYFIVEPEKSEEYKKAKEEEEKSWLEKNIDTIIGVAANLIPVAGQIASAVILGTSAIFKGMEKAELEDNMKEFNVFLGRVNGLHGYFGLVPYEWDLPAFFRNEYWLKENDRLMINQYQDQVQRLVKDVPGNDYLKSFPWVYRFLGRAAIQANERVLSAPPGVGAEGSLLNGVAYYERDGYTYPAGKFADYFKMGVIGSKYNVTVFKYKDWKMTG